MTHDHSEQRTRRGTAEDIANLVALYAQLAPDAQGELLTSAVEALAAQRVRGLSAPNGRPLEPDDWLADLADGTYPRGDETTRLIDLATDADMDARSMIFGDGLLSIVLSTSSDEMMNGEAVYEGYLSVRNEVAGSWELPEPAPFLGIHVAEADFEQWEDDGWVLDTEALKAEVRRRCIAEFASMVALWRSDFFAAVLSDCIPKPPSAAKSAAAPTMTRR